MLYKTDLYALANVEIPNDEYGFRLLQKAYTINRYCNRFVDTRVKYITLHNFWLLYNVMCIIHRD